MKLTNSAIVLSLLLLPACTTTPSNKDLLALQVLEQEVSSLQKQSDHAKADLSRRTPDNARKLQMPPAESVLQKTYPYHERVKDLKEMEKILKRQLLGYRGANEYYRAALIRDVDWEESAP